MKKFPTLITCIVLMSLCLIFCACNASTDTSSYTETQDVEDTQDTDQDKEDSSAASDDTQATLATVTVKGYDSFQIQLDSDDAPESVENFCKLAKEGFYDGLTFHRIVKDFCLQGGDPDGTGSGGSDETIEGEFSSNGVDNELADNFKKGVVAMARASDPDSATSQFFITLSSSESVSQSLDGQYAAFGIINKAGMKIVDQIVDDYISKATGSSGTIENISDQPVIKSIKISK